MNFVRCASAALLASILLPGCTILPDPGVPTGYAGPVDYEDPVLNQRRVLLVGDITEASATTAIQQLFYLDGKGDQPIDLMLMTPGGDLGAAFAIEHAMRSVRAPVNTVALGDCNSSGAVLLAAGTGKRRAYHDSVIVIHGMEINGKVPRRYIDLSQESYADFWRRRARLPESWLPLPLGKVIFLTPEEAVEYGVIDEIIPPWESGKPEAVGR